VKPAGVLEPVDSQTAGTEQGNKAWIQIFTSSIFGATMAKTATKKKAAAGGAKKKAAATGGKKGKTTQAGGAKKKKSEPKKVSEHRLGTRLLRPAGRPKFVWDFRLPR